MSLTTSVNKKANVKQHSTADLPYAPSFPIAARYEATSTAGQTVINMSFSVDTTATDSFMLYYNGALLRAGALNDYTFTSVAADNTTSQVTLNYGMSLNKNIVAIKLSVKKESEFQIDNRLVNLYAGMTAGFQAFADITNTLAATSTVGVPASGKFYSTIIGRAAITDITQDLKASFGGDRLPVQQTAVIPSEAGANGEIVQSAVGDDRGLIRFVGNWSNNTASYGAYASASFTGTDYLEIVFYGTGLNLLTTIDSNSRPMTFSINGGTPVAVAYPASGSGILQGRNYASNQVLNIATGLTLGVYTVRINSTATSVASVNVFGFEILGPSTAINVNPGTSYAGGRKAQSTAAGSLIYNTGFESGTLGTRGGRAVVYQKSDGTYGKAVTPVNAATALFTVADHTNEEAFRPYNFREFGASRSDDFSLFSATSGGTLAFTLDDGTTTLVGSNVGVNTTNGNIGVGPQSNGGWLTINFVGCGIDLVMNDTATGGSDSYSAVIDGTVNAWPYTVGSTTVRTVKIASGLPYGSHSLKILRNSASTWQPNVKSFIVYQPKKPAIPSGAFEVGDYNIMANYALNSTATTNAVSAGVLRKMATREFIYSGSWTMNVVDPAQNSGWQLFTSTSGSYAQQTFFGTGLDYRFEVNSGSANNFTITIDGASNLSGFTIQTALNSGLTFTAATGILSGTGTPTTNGNCISISGLTPGWHTIRITMNTTTFMYLDCIDVITPIHAHKSNNGFDQQNTLPVGSLSISDSRKFTPLKDPSANKKNISQATGIISGPTTTSTTMTPCPDMFVTHTNTTGRLMISYNVQSAMSGGNGAFWQIFVDGVAVSKTMYSYVQSLGNLQDGHVSDLVIANVSPGQHEIVVQWAVTGGTGTADGTFRDLTVLEV